MSMTFDPYKSRSGKVDGTGDVIMTNPTAPAELERYWSSLPKTRGVPKRKDVDAVAMAGLLEDSFILERVAPGVARIRVAGRNVGKLIGIEPRGLPLTALMFPQSRAAMANHLEAAFSEPAIVELPLEAPRAVRQPKLQGKILLLPLRDDHGVISRVLGILVMSGRRGEGGRRFVIAEEGTVRVEPVLGLHLVDTSAPSGKAAKMPALRAVPQTERRRPSLREKTSKGTKDRPVLRLVVSNP